MLNWLLFMELIPVWLLMSYITAAKDYKAILLTFLAGVLLALLGGPALHASGVDALTALMSGLTLGYGVMLVGMLRVLLRYFPRGQGSLLGFVAWFSHTPDLLLTGFLSMTGAFVHIVLMWFGPLGGTVTGLFRQAPLFDSAAFYAYLVTLPTNINFIISVEVNFYSAYREYFSAITDGGTMSQIRLARTRMSRSLWQEITNLIVVQIFAMVVYMLLARYFLPAVGFTSDMMHMFRLMCIGYSLYCIGTSLMLLLLYFNDRYGAMGTAAVFFLGNLAGTLASMRLGLLYYSSGVIVGGLLMYLVAFPRLALYVRRIDYKVFCSQPVFNEMTNDRWKKLAGWLEARAARRANR
ncbi:MAG: exopolysaccharide Pel transporter PelG, partial [Clostridia bacterium]|nr:exopolysaccharide Pel transporter PelG [Clostridia bacterium]